MASRCISWIPADPPALDRTSELLKPHPLVPYDGWRRTRDRGPSGENQPHRLSLPVPDPDGRGRQAATGRAAPGSVRLQHTKGIWEGE